MHTKTALILFCGIAVLCSSHAFGSEPVVVAQGTGETAPKQPQAAVAADGAVHLIYGVGDAVFYTQSTNGAETFSQPQEAFRVPNLMLGMRRGPRIAVAGNTVVVTAIGGTQGKGRDGDLQAWRSADGGATWQGPVKVNDAADAAREGLHGMASGADGSVWCVWLDLRDKQSEVYASKSTDGGATWSSNVRVYRSPDGSVCECCHPSVNVTDGAVHVMFRNSLAGNRDMYVATSADGGMLAAGPKGSLVTVWRRNGDIFSASSTGGKESLLGRGEQPWLTSSANGPVAVWTAGREGDLLVQSPASRQPQKLSGTARDPMIASAANGTGPVVACWESKRDGKTVVMAARIDTNKAKSR